MIWLLRKVIRPRRFALAALGAAFPVALLGATLMLVDASVHSMTEVALAPLQVEMRALATSLNVDMGPVDKQLAAVPGVKRVERFASADVTVNGRSARLFAVDQEYLDHHPWVHVVSGSLGAGALLTGLDPTASITVGMPENSAAPATPPPGGEGDGQPAPTPPATVRLPVSGTIDLRQATTWFAMPIGDVQGDIAVVPRAIVVDYATFERTVLPLLKSAADTALNPNATDLPPVTIEAHITVDHATYPSDPARAAAFSTTLRRVLERQSPGSIIVADNAAEALALARADATNAKILMVLLGIPGALVAGGLGLATATALAEAQRREDALLELRGASGSQLARLAAGQAGLAGLVGAAAGLVVAFAAVRILLGFQVWQRVPAGRLAVSVGIALLAGAIAVAVRVVPLIRAARRGGAGVVVDRRLLDRAWRPSWRRSRLDLILIGVGALILAVNLLTGGLRMNPIEGQVLALAFYVLLAPLALWFGVTLLVIRLAHAGLVRGTRPDRERRLRTWPGAAVRWLGRRPARTGTTLVLGALAVAFGTQVVTFVATYHAAQAADRAAAFGADVRLVPPPTDAGQPADAGPTAITRLAATTPIRLVPARVGTDRKNIMAIDPATFGKATTETPRMLDGAGLPDLAAQRDAVLVHAEIAEGFSVSPGDTLTLTVFPDDPTRTQNLKLRVAGVYRSFPPTEPFSELVMNAAAIPGGPVAPDFHLGRLAPGTTVDAVRGAAGKYTVLGASQLTLPEQRTLTALNLRALSRLEVAAAGTVAALGVAVLGAFLVLERRREAAVLRSVGATTAQTLTPPAVEGAIAVLGSLLIGLPIGVGLAVLSIQVLGLFFTLPPPIVVLPGRALATLAGVTLGASLAALGVALWRVARQRPAAMLREP